MPTEEEINDLAEAMWQLLDDMGRNGKSVCLAAKAQARIAYEPFADWTDWNQDMIDTWMSLEDAKAIVDQC